MQIGEIVKGFTVNVPSSEKCGASDCDCRDVIGIFPNKDDCAKFVEVKGLKPGEFEIGMVAFELHDNVKNLAELEARHKNKGMIEIMPGVFAMQLSGDEDGMDALHNVLSRIFGEDSHS